MPTTITIPDLFSATPPHDRLESPTVTAADVTITIDGVTTQTTNPPAVNPDGSVSIELTEAEYADGAVVTLRDVDGQWGSLDYYVVIPVNNTEIVSRSSTRRQNRTNLKATSAGEFTFRLQAFANSELANLLGKSLQVVIEDRFEEDIEVIGNQSISRDSETYSFTTIAANEKPGVYFWSCRTTDGQVIGHGDYIVEHAASVDG